VGVRPEIRYHVLTWRDLKRSFAGPQSHGAVLTHGHGRCVQPRAGRRDSAFIHRSERFLLDHVARGGDQWLDRSWTRAHAHASGRVYPNFPDPDLDDWAAAYHGGNAERLRAVKRRYDPERLFRFPQAI
jgi:hypothetical protein